MRNRIAGKPEADIQKQGEPMRIIADPEQIGTDSIVVYLFSKPKAKKLFICNRPASLAELIKRTKQEATVVTEQYI